MAIASRIAGAIGTVAIALLTSGCITSGPSFEDPSSGQPQGPLPPSNTSITLLQLAGLVSEEDAPPQALFDVGAASTSGADLSSEQDYWVSVGGMPAECADVVSSPYLVSSADASDPARADDPTGALATFTEDEDLFGLVQVYGRVFDDAETASGFLDEFSGTVASCSGYRFVGPEGEVTYEATGLRIDEPSGAPAGTRVLTFSEEVSGSEALGVGITFLQHENAVVSLYSELYPSSTMTPADVEGLVAAVRDRLAVL